MDLAFSHCDGELTKFGDIDRYCCRFLNKVVYGHHLVKVFGDIATDFEAEVT